MKTRLPPLFGRRWNVALPILLLAAPALLSFAQVAPPTAPPAVAAPPAEVAPEATAAAATNVTGAEEATSSMVTLDEVDLPEALRNLARGAELNIQFDPKLWPVGPDGKPIVPSVSVKWKGVTAMQAFQALLDNYNLQMVTDPKTPIVRIATKNPAELEPLVTKVIQLKYSNPTNISSELTNLVLIDKRAQLIPDIRTHQLVVMFTEKDLARITNLIEQLDAPIRQVLIEAKIVETTKDITSAKGVNWSGTLANQNISFGNGLTSASALSGAQSGNAIAAPTAATSPSGRPLSTAGNTLFSNATSTLSTITGSTSSGGGFSLNTAKGINPATAFLNADGVQAVLSFLNTDADTRSIAFPRTVALDGIQTVIEVVQNIPIFEQQQSAGAPGTAPLATVKPNYQLAVGNHILTEVGVKLMVTPRIAGPTNVLMELRPEISSQDAVKATDVLNGQTSTSPIFDRRSVTTTASVPSGYTLVLGGLDQDMVTRSMTKVPLLGDLPGLGYAFRSNSKTHTRDNILLFVTPTIISDADLQHAPSQFEKTRNDAEPSPPEKAWTSGEPYDWTKPKGAVSPVYQP